MLSKNWLLALLGYAGVGGAGLVLETESPTATVLELQKTNKNL